MMFLEGLGDEVPCRPMVADPRQNAKTPGSTFRYAERER